MEKPSMDKVSEFAYITKVVENNKEFVLIEITKECKPIDLIKLGCFNGDEIMFRITKGDNHTITIWKNNGKHYSWNYGMNGYTIVTEQLDKQRNLIEGLCLYYYGYSMTKYDKSTHTTKEDMPSTCIMKRMGTNFECTHKDGEYFTHVKNDFEFINILETLGYNKHKMIKEYNASNGCPIREYLCSIEE